ncbi:hypothetical protein ACPCSP_25625 [Streptomyces cinereoruber]|uniref:hypothetical protein n=1 Tax=Streptomyces cinereoruber TaxID=67260 RepID=UPI003C2E3730
MSTTASPSGPRRLVHVRTGTFRKAYHPNPACPSLNGKPETYSGQEAITEAQAQRLGLTECGNCPPAPAQPAETEFATAPLYEIAYDYRANARPFTVSVAGPGRHDGEPPALFVVEAHKTEEAWAKVLAWYMVEHETVDAIVVAGESFQGVPAGRAWFWLDLRPEYVRREALDDLADQAAELIGAFEEETGPLLGEEGEPLPQEQSTYETALGDAAFSAWPLVLELAGNDGRD